MKFKRLLSLFLALTVAFSCIGITALADEEKPQYLVNTLYKLKNDKELTVGYLGGSVMSAEGIEKDAQDYYSFRGLTQNWFSENFPEASGSIREINASKAGVDSAYATFLADKTLLGGDVPDLVFIELATDDNKSGIYGTNENYVYIEAIVRKIYSANPYADIVFVVAGSNATLTKDFINKKPTFGEPYAKVASHYDIPVIHAGYELLLQMLKENNNQYPTIKSNAWNKYFTDSVLPNFSGNQAYADIIAEFLSKNLITDYAPDASDLVNRTDIANSIYCTENGKESGSFSVEKLLDASVVAADEIVNKEQIGEFWIGYQDYDSALTSSRGIGGDATFTFNSSNIALWTWTFGGAEAPDGTSVGFTVDYGQEKQIEFYSNTSGFKMYTVATGLSGSEHTLRINHSNPNASFRILYFLMWDVKGSEAQISAVSGFDSIGSYSVKLDGVEFSRFDPNVKSYEITLSEDQTYPALSFETSSGFSNYKITQASDESPVAIFTFNGTERYTFKFVKEQKEDQNTDTDDKPDVDDKPNDTGIIIPIPGVGLPEDDSEEEFPTDTNIVRVKFSSEGVPQIPDIIVEKGTLLKKPEDPKREGYTFDGWYKDAMFTERFFFGTTPINATTYLFAKWLTPDDVAKRMVLTIDKKEAVVFGKAATNDVAPIIRNDRTMLPARFVAENLGAEIEWDEAERKVTVKKDKTEILIYIDSDIAKVNGKEVKLDSPAFIENSRTYTPVRFVVENLGAKIEWKEDEREVVIIKQ